jgi:hypothetical protein
MRHIKLNPLQLVFRPSVPVLQILCEISQVVAGAQQNDGQQPSGQSEPIYHDWRFLQLEMDRPMLQLVMAKPISDSAEHDVKVMD